MKRPRRDQTSVLIAAVSHTTEVEIRRPLARESLAELPEVGKLGQCEVEITPPKLISPFRPAYPERARQQGIQGRVMIEAVIRRTGEVDRVVVLRMPEGGEWLAGAAVDAVSR